MSSEEVGCKPEGKRETFEISAENDGGENANERHVFEKDPKGGKETQESNTLTREIIDVDNHQEKNTPALEPVKKAPDKRESTTPDLKDGKDDQTLAGESPKTGLGEEQSDPERRGLLKLFYTLPSCTKSQSGYFSFTGILLVASVVCFVAFFLGPPKNDMKADFQSEGVFRNGLGNLQSKFTNQTDRFWKILRIRGSTHLRSKDPSRPLVFLLAAPPAAHEWVDCLAIKLAEMLDSRHKNTLARFHGEKEKANPPDQTKITMDNFLKEKIDVSHKAVLIHHLELLPPPSQLLFHSYCDDQNAPYKHLAIIFTVHMPVEPSPSLSSKQAEESVKKYLSHDVWAKGGRNADTSLLSRVADTVVLMNGETSGLARDFCS